MVPTDSILAKLTPQDIERFWSKVNKEPGQGPCGDCWEWQAGRFPHGYGAFALQSRNQRAQRVAYAIFYNEDPADKNVCHACDNPPCCNPAHLFKGSHQENVQDRVRKDRTARGSYHPNSVLTESQVAEIKDALRHNRSTGVQLAALYGVTPQAICLINRGKNWAHVT